MTSEHNVFRIFVAPTRYSVSFQFYSRSTSGTNCTSEKYGWVKSPRVRLRLKVCGLIAETYFSFFKERNRTMDQVLFRLYSFTVKILKPSFRFYCSRVKGNNFGPHQNAEIARLWRKMSREACLSLTLRPCLVAAEGLCMSVSQSVSVRLRLWPIRPHASVMSHSSDCYFNFEGGRLSKHWAWQKGLSLKKNVYAQREKSLDQRK